MSALPDPAELAPSRDPAAYRARPLLSGGFWAMMALAAVCLVAGAVIVTMGPRLLAIRRAQPVAAAGSAPTATSTNAPAPAATTGSAPYPAAALAPGLAPAPMESAAPERVADLEGRVQALESRQARQLDAAAAALAAAALSQAAAQPRPFLAELAAFQRLLPASPDAQALEPLAAQGAPGRAALAVELADIAAEVSTAAKAPPRTAGFMAQLAYALSRVVSVRRVDQQASGADGVLARAQRLADEGDLEGAAASLDGLPSAARLALAPWRVKAMRRITIDEHIAALRAQAAADLAAAQGSLPVAPQGGAPAHAGGNAA